LTEEAYDISDFEPDQVWRQGDAHVKVELVNDNGLVTLQ
jgi:hypothetical protein